MNNVRGIIQHAFKTKQLPGSIGITPTKSGRAPNTAELIAQEFVPWAAAAERWPALLPFLPDKYRRFSGSWEFPLFGKSGAFTKTPTDVDELQKRLSAAEDDNVQLRERNAELTEQNADLTKRLKKCEAKLSRKGRGGRPRSRRS